MYVCANADCITWPNDVATVEGINLFHHGIVLRNMWYEFGEAIRAPWRCNCADIAYSFDRPSAPQNRNFPYTQQYIRLYPSVAADAGETVILQGFDSNGLPIRTLVDEDYIDGEQVTLESPFITSTFLFTGAGLSGAQKPITKGRIDVYAVDSVTGDEALIATWDPYDENPSFRRSYIPRGSCTTSSCITTACCTPNNGCDPLPAETCVGNTFEAIVRVEYRPSLVDSDWLLISNREAVKCGMKALVKEDQNQYSEAEIEWARAKSILRNELDKYDPPQEILINPRPMGTATLNRVFAGFI